MKKKAPSSEERYAEWVRYVEAAFHDITEGWWNRKLFRAVDEMFRSNPALRRQEGAGEVYRWMRRLYAHYAIMLVGRDLDRQPGNLSQILRDMELHHAVLVSHAKTIQPVPTARQIAQDRRQLEKQTKKVSDHRNRVVGHRTPVKLPPLTFDDVDHGLRAVREVLIKYRGVLLGVDLLSATASPNYDWLAPFRVPWWYRGFVEPPLEEDRALTPEERRADDEQFRKIGFRRS